LVIFNIVLVIFNIVLVIFNIVYCKHKAQLNFVLTKFSLKNFIVCLFTVSCFAQEFITYVETSPLTVKGSNLFAYAWACKAFEQGARGIFYRATTAVTRALTCI
jgi:hypothetical protein